MNNNTACDLSAITTTDLDDVSGGANINFDQPVPATVADIDRRAAVCRGLNDEAQRRRAEAGGGEPAAGSPAGVMAAATRACWASIGGSR